MAGGERGSWCEGQPLHLLNGLERIESGWWDFDAVERDDYIAQLPDGALVWIFRQRVPGVGASLNSFLQGRSEYIAASRRLRRRPPEEISGHLRRLGAGPKDQATRPNHHTDKPAESTTRSAAAAANSALTSVSFFSTISRVDKPWYTCFRSAAVPA